MNFITVLASFVLFVSAAVFAEQNKSKKSLTRQSGPASPCSKQLANIVYYPQLPAFNYLEKLMFEFQKTAQYILTQLNAGNRGPLGDFMKKYHAQVSVNDGFGPWNVFALSPSGQALPVYGLQGYNYFYHSEAQAMLTGVAYGFNPELNMYEVTFVLKGNDAITSLVSISVSAGTVFAC